MRTYVLLTNALLLLFTTLSLLYNLSPTLLLPGLLLGCLLALPSVVVQLRPDIAGPYTDRSLLKINTVVVVVLVTIIFFIMYFLLTGSYESNLALQHFITLICALGLCANSQLLLMSTSSGQHREELATVNDLIHRAFGGPPIWLLLALALVVTGLLQTLITTFEGYGAVAAILKSKLIDRGVIPFLTIAGFFWGLFLLVGNVILVRSESRRLGIEISDRLADKRKQSILSLAFLRYCKESQRKNKSEIRQLLPDFMDGVWNKVNYFYTLPRYINWAIPILGFIGTVFGISLAAESIGRLISSNDTGFGSGLGEAVAPLGIAFDTTLVALTLSVVLMLVQSLLQRWQERQLHAMEQKLRLEL